MKATKIFAAALENATNVNDLDKLHIYADSVSYSKKLKLQIIEVAKQNGYIWYLDESKEYNKVSKRFFSLNLIKKS